MVWGRHELARYQLEDKLCKKPSVGSIQKLRTLGGTMGWRGKKRTVVKLKAYVRHPISSKKIVFINKRNKRYFNPPPAPSFQHSEDQLHWRNLSHAVLHTDVINALIFYYIDINTPVTASFVCCHLFMMYISSGIQYGWYTVLVVYSTGGIQYWWYIVHVGLVKHFSFVELPTFVKGYYIDIK